MRRSGEQSGQDEKSEGVAKKRQMRQMWKETRQETTENGRARDRD